MLTKLDIVVESMSSRSSSRVLSLSTVPSRSSTWPTKSQGPAAMNPVAMTPLGSPGQNTSPATCSLMNRPNGTSLVERADHIVAIRPGVVAALVFVIAVSVAIMDDIEPVPPPPLAMVRTGQQSIDQRFVSERTRIMDERLDLLGSRRQAEQVERKAPDQGAAIGLGAVLEPVFFQCGEDERVDRRTNPVRPLSRWNLGPP